MSAGEDVEATEEKITLSSAEKAVDASLFGLPPLPSLRRQRLHSRVSPACIPGSPRRAFPGLPGVYKAKR